MPGILGVQQGRLTAAQPEDRKKEKLSVALTHGLVPSSASLVPQA
jgi:hypothetical protein